MYDRAATLSSEHEHAATVGKAHALLALDRADELALFDRIGSQHLSDLEALEGLVLALRHLGHDAEAEAVLGRIYTVLGASSGGWTARPRLGRTADIAASHFAHVRGAARGMRDAMR